jgi:hypothetical protein
MPSFERKHRRFCVLAGYYDDSADDYTFVVGGFISSVSRWEAFTDDWQVALHQNPRIDYYKAYEANVLPELRKSNNQFRGFSRGMILRKEKTLANVIAQHVEYSVYSAIDRNDFNTIVLPRVERRKRGIGRYTGHEYLFPFHGCISATVKHLKDENVDDQVDFFFDDQGKVGKWSRDMYEELKTHTSTKDMRPYLGVCVPHDDKKVVALQAADLWASRCRKYGDAQQVSDPICAILNQIPCNVAYWPKSRLQTMVAKIYPETDSKDLHR